MLETIKNSSWLTKLMYLFAFIVFIVWVIPTMKTYYNNVNSYQKSLQELENISSKHGLPSKAEKFTATTFKENSELIFKKVDVKNLGDNSYEIHVSMEKGDLKSFHTFIETIALRYYVEIQGALKFQTEEETITAKMTLKAF